MFSERISAIFSAERRIGLAPCRGPDGWNYWKCRPDTVWARWAARRRHGYIHQRIQVRRGAGGIEYYQPGL